MGYVSFREGNTNIQVQHHYSPFLNMGDPGSGIFLVSTHARTSEHMDPTVLKIIELVVDPNSNMIQVIFMEDVVYLFLFHCFVSTEWKLGYVFSCIHNIVFIKKY